jgi:SWI/SNF-related matrix-associated actin-dependent regulator of chromatin subfamily A3
MNVSELDNLQLVLTTYHTVAAEWKGKSESQTSILFSQKWRRLVLDEG